MLGSDMVTCHISRGCGPTTSTGEVVTGLFLFCFHKSSADMPNSEAVAEVVVVVVDATELVLDMLETFERTPKGLA